MSQLRRELGVFQAILLGLGSIVGTGVFVSIGIAAGITGPTVVGAALAAGLVAAANGMSSAQLAAAHPVSGGTYVYATRLLSPSWGFVAGWMFLCAKSASAATAALGFSGYLGLALDWDTSSQRWVALAIVFAVGGLVLTGTRRSAAVNTLLVGFVLATLGVFIVAGLGEIDRSLFTASGGTGMSSWLEATALMFVAYTGYGRIATLGEEVRDPKRTIPIAILATMAITITLYVLVAATGIGTIGAEALAATTEGTAAPLAAATESFAPGITSLVELAAIVAMAGVLLNLILGLSRVVLAMGRERDLPPLFASINPAGTTPVPATLLMIGVVAGLTLLGDVRTTWTFSAVTVLIYYTLTNVSAMRLPAADRRFPRWIPVAGAIACLGLAFFIDPIAWLAAIVILGAGFAMRWFVRPGPSTPING